MTVRGRAMEKDLGTRRVVFLSEAFSLPQEGRDVRGLGALAVSSERGSNSMRSVSDGECYSRVGELVF